MAFLSFVVYSRFSGWRGRHTVNIHHNRNSCYFLVRDVTTIFSHLDVSVGDVHVVEKFNGCADVPHNLRCLWEQNRQTESLKPEAVPVSHSKRTALRDTVTVLSSIVKVIQSAATPSSVFTFLSEGLVSSGLDSTEQLSSLHAEHKKSFIK